MDYEITVSGPDEFLQVTHTFHISKGDLHPMVSHVHGDFLSSGLLRLQWSMSLHWKSVLGYQVCFRLLPLDSTVNIPTPETRCLNRFLLGAFCGLIVEGCCFLANCRLLLCRYAWSRSLKSLIGSGVLVSGAKILQPSLRQEAQARRSSSQIVPVCCLHFLPAVRC